MGKAKSTPVVAPVAPEEPAPSVGVAFREGSIAYRITRAMELADTIVCSLTTNRYKEAPIESAMEILVEQLRDIADAAEMIERNAEVIA